jgi:hypothetical protein
MTKEEYKQKIKDLKAEYDTRREAIISEYAISNSEISRGDIIGDGNHRIRVDVINVDSGEHWDGFPYCVYVGPKITKELKLHRRELVASISQHKGVKIIKKGYKI